MLKVSTFPKPDDARYWDKEQIKKTLIDCGFSEENGEPKHESWIMQFTVPVFDPTIPMFSVVAIFRSLDCYTVFDSVFGLEFQFLLEIEDAQRLASYLTRLHCAIYAIDEKRCKEWCMMRKTEIDIIRQFEDED